MCLYYSCVTAGIAILAWVLFRRTGFLVFAGIMLVLIAIQLLRRKPAEAMSPDRPPAPPDRGEPLTAEIFPVEPFEPAPAVEDFATVLAQLPTEMRFPVDGAGELACEPGPLTAGFRLAFHYKAPEEEVVNDFPVDSLRCSQRLADNQGAVWEAAVYLAPGIISRAFARRLAENAVHPYASAPAEWRQAFTQAALLPAPVTDIDDSQELYTIVLDGRTVFFCFDDALLRYYLALLPAEDGDTPDTLAVRVDGAWGSGCTLPTLAFTMPAGDLLLVQSAEYHEADHDWVSLDEPLPVTFHRTGLIAEPQSRIAFVKA